MDLSNINFLAVAIGALVAFVFGALWYNGNVFGKIWQKELGYSDEDLKGANMPMIFLGSFVLMFVMSFGLAWGMSLMESEQTWQTGLKHGSMLGIFFIATSIGINYLYQRRSIKLWIIDSLYQLIFLAGMGAIIGAMQ